MYLTFKSEALELSRTSGSWSLLPFFLRVLSDWLVTLWKELAASLLVFVYMTLDVLPKSNAAASRH
jgi:hypothetical protein